MCKSYICLPKKVDGVVLHERVKILTWVSLLQINHRYISVCSLLLTFEPHMEVFNKMESHLTS